MNRALILTYIYGTNESMYIKDKYSIGDTLIHIYIYIITKNTKYYIKHRLVCGLQVISIRWLIKESVISNKKNINTTPLYYTILYYTILYYTILYYTILYYKPGDLYLKCASN